MRTRSCERGQPIRLSEIGLGTWPLGGTACAGDEVIGRGEVSESQATATILAAIDSGVTFFDTADIYGLGRSEERLGKTLKRIRSSHIIATKVGKIVRPDRTIGSCFDPAHIFRSADASLRRLRSDAIDIYLLHNPSIATVSESEVVSCMEALKQAGKIRFWGVSARHVNDAVAMLEADFAGDFIEVVFNLLRQDAALRCFPLARRAGVGLIVRVPLEYGVLTGRFTRDTRFPADDHRHYTLEERLGADLAKVEALQQVLYVEGANMTLTALRFCLAFPEVTSIVTGARSPAQISLNASASDIGPLSAHIVEELQRVYYRDIAVPAN